MAQSVEMQSKQMCMKKAQDQESTLTPNLICCMCHFTDISEDRWKAMSIKSHMEESVLVRVTFTYHGFEQTPLHGYSTVATLVSLIPAALDASLLTLLCTGLVRVLLQSSSDSLAMGKGTCPAPNQGSCARAQSVQGQHPTRHSLLCTYILPPLLL